MNESDAGVVLRVTNPTGLDRSNESVRIGVPWPRSTLNDASQMVLADIQGREISPVQVRPLAHWSDGSVQWLQVDAALDLAPHESSALTLRPSRQVTVPRHRLRVSETASDIEVDTGMAVFRLTRAGQSLISSVTVASRELLAAPGLAITFRDAKGTVREVRIDRTVVAEQGDLRCSITAEGVIADTDRLQPLAVLARVDLVAGSATAELEVRIRNPRRARHRGGLWDLGDPGSQLIGDLALQASPAGPVTSVWWSPSPDVACTAVDPASGLALYQDSSGGEQWQSPNHLGADGSATVTFRGYRVNTAGGDLLAEGHRAQPRLIVDCEGGAMACAVEDFWQNFPKALRFSGGKLQIALFPASAGSPVELQGGEQKRHRVWLAFGARQSADASIVRRQLPSHVTVDPADVARSGAVYGFRAPGESDDARYFSYMQTIIEGDRSFFAGREIIDEYGWRNHGDIYADHEAVNHRGSGPFISHYNNQYDFVLGSVLHGLRSGDPRWFQLMRDLARHVIDIDVYHTDVDKAAFNGGLFWHSDHYLPAGLATHRTYSRSNAGGKASYGGGPSNEHNYTSGLLHYHLLTGDEDARDTVVSLANFVIDMDDGARTLFAVLDAGPTGDASKTVSADYHGPGRGAGNSINALLDAFHLTRERRYIRKAEQLIERCIHPSQDIASLQLDEPERRWSYLVFLQVLGKYLSVKIELEEEDYTFRYARASLMHFARWMLDNETPYKDVLHKVELPTETWPAQDVRKASVLQTAAAYCADESLRSRLRASAAEFARRCLQDLLAFPTAHLARPRVLLAVYGLAVYGTTGSSGARARGASAPEVFDPPVPFVPQRQAWRESIRRRASATFGALREQLRDRLIR
jgi:hypothetical protein